MSVDDETSPPRLRSTSTSEVATYRLQLSPTYTFDDAAAICGYLATLGVDRVYTSPILQAAKGSTHGYDVVDHGRVWDALGGEEAWRRFVDAMRAHGLRQLADVVPNHMSIGDRANRWWWDVLENGPASRFASFFDVDWDPPDRRNRDTVLLPVLGDHRAKVLQRGELKVVRESACFVLKYFEHCFPIAPRSLDEILITASERMPPSDAALLLGYLADAYGGLPSGASRDVDVQARRHRDKTVLEALLARLLRDEPVAARAVDQALDALNADPIALDDFLDRQNHRVAYWKTAGQELDYRRFFDVSSLAALRIEEPVVFDATHALLRRWIEDGVCDGVRVDHVDGLFDPKGYLERLRALAPDARVVVEKILEPDEELRADWPVEGTTGYDFLNDALLASVDPRGEEPLTKLYAERTGETRPFREIAAEKREMVLRDVLGSDVNRLVDELAAIAGRRRTWRDATRQDLLRGLRAVLAAFPVYRTYARPFARAGERRLSDDDARVIERAVGDARTRHPDVDPCVYDLLQDLLTLKLDGREEEQFCARFQQTSGPAVAKGVEDTAFYAYGRFVALNEVGGDPGTFGAPLARFHERNARAAERWPRRMLALSTHDTKRSEDVRARLVLLSEIPDAWARVVSSWCAKNAAKKTDGMPDGESEYLLYQTLVGAWPLPRDRALRYMEKAAREAKTKTSWTKPNAAYDAALAAFVERCFDDREFLDDVAAFASGLAAPGRAVSLAWTLWRCTCPGVPDVYQGTETWALDLVDPDNRRPVDYDARRALLETARRRTPEQLLVHADDGGPKMRLLFEALQLRKRKADAFAPGASYRPIDVHDGVVAYARGDGVVAVAPRFGIAAQRGFGDATVALPRGMWRDVITDERHEGAPRVDRLTARFPVALLEREAP